MGAPEFSERVGKRGFSRPSGSGTFEQGLEFVAGVVRWARDEQLPDVLIDIRGFTLVGQLTTFMRYEFGKRIAEAGGGMVRVAFVANASLIDPQKIGALVAQNRGMNVEVFESEADALKWLDARASREYPTR
jgi:hypothetical protein